MMYNQEPYLHTPYSPSDILKDSHPALRGVSQEANPNDATDKTIAQKLMATVESMGALGIAAPQVGIHLRIIAIKDNSATPIQRIMFNPQIIARDGKKRMTEGCLSLPGKSVEVKRSKRITVRYQNIDGEEITEKFSGLAARIILHEVDHLNGKLMTDYA